MLLAGPIGRLFLMSALLRIADHKSDIVGGPKSAMNRHRWWTLRQRKSRPKAAL